MKKKIFAVSDIHGNYPALIEALKDAGFDENNDSHLLVVLGILPKLLGSSPEETLEESRIYFLAFSLP